MFVSNIQQGQFHDYYKNKYIFVFDAKNDGPQFQQEWNECKYLGKIASRIIDSTYDFSIKQFIPANEYGFLIPELNCFTMITDSKRIPLENLREKS